MTLIARAATGFTVVAVTFAATTASGQEAIEDALGGPIVACSGAIAWTESGSDGPRVEPMRLAARDVDDTNRIVLFLSEDDIDPENAWSCMDGACTATRTVRSGVTVNALRLHHEVDLGSGEAVYGMTAVFVIINAEDTPIQVSETSGTGSFICEKPLPESLVANAE